MAVTRPLVLDDAPNLANVLSANRDFLAPWQPNRPDEYFTSYGQHGFVQGLLQQQAAEVCPPLVILDEVGGIAGMVTLQSIIRGAFQSCSVGYWLAESAQGRGLATRAVGEAAQIAFEVLRPHRVQAETLTHNLRSQRVLDRLGFVQYGRAEAYNAHRRYVAGSPALPATNADAGTCPHGLKNRCGAGINSPLSPTARSHERDHLPPTAHGPLSLETGVRSRRDHSQRPSATDTARCPASHQP